MKGAKEEAQDNRAAAAVERAARVLANANLHSKALARMTAAHARKPLPDHCAFDRFNRLESCSCKCCGAAISGLQPHDSLRDVVRDGGKTVIFERVSMAAFANYSEITIEFDDGSHHSTGICLTCKKELLGKPLEKQLEEAEWMYAADVRAMLKEHGVRADQINWTPWADRKPVALRG